MSERQAGRVEGWDFIRGFGMFFVLLAHGLDGAEVHPSLHGPGIVGLTAFFVLSGYLITGILARDISRHGRVRFKVFYWHRFVRLIPALAVMLVLYVIIESIIDSHPDPTWASVLVGIFYVANMPFLRDFAGGLRQMWSLSFEEQFYFIWPTALTVALRYRRAIRWTAIAIGVSTCLAVVSILLSLQAPERVYTLQTTWAGAVLVGCLGYLAHDKVLAIVKPRTRGGAPLFVVAVLVLLAGAVLFDHERPWMYLGGTTLVGFAGLVMVVWAESWHEVRQWWLRPFFGLGVISYAAYLYNYPLTVFLDDRIENPVMFVPLTMGLSVVCGVISWYLVEKPAQRRWRGKFSNPVKGGADRSLSGST